MWISYQWWQIEDQKAGEVGKVIESCCGEIGKKIFQRVHMERAFMFLGLCVAEDID